MARLRLRLAGSAATKGGQQAGKKSVGQSDPHYNTNFRAGQATFSDRNRKIKKSLGEALTEAIGKAARWRAAQKVKGAVTPERVAAGTAAGVGLTYVGSKAAGGVKQGRQDKRRQGASQGVHTRKQVSGSRVRGRISEPPRGIGCQRLWVREQGHTGAASQRGC